VSTLRLPTAAAVLSCVAVLAAPAAAHGLAGSPGPTTLSVAPSRIILDGAARTVVSVTNSGRAKTTISSALGNYLIGADGEVTVDPKLPPGRSAKRWLKAVPSRVVLAPGQTARLTLSSRPSRSAQPGDHHAVLLLSTVAAKARGVAVRTRVGVTVLVRVRGPIVRRLRPLGLSVARRGRVRLVRLKVANAGNVNERFAASRAVLELRRHGKVVARLQATTRSLLPGTAGYLTFRYRGLAAGTATALVRVRPTPAGQAGPAITSTPTTIVVRAKVRL
jgi:hypothetical protein